MRRLPRNVSRLRRSPESKANKIGKWSCSFNRGLGCKKIGIGAFLVLWGYAFVFLHRSAERSKQPAGGNHIRFSIKGSQKPTHVNISAERRSMSKTTVDKIDSIGAAGAAPVIGTYALWKSSEVVYSIPTTKTKPIGIALLLHACTHNALKFFSPSSRKCQKCVGLSEEIRISRMLLSRGYAVLAITSSNRKSGCWGGTLDSRNVQDSIVRFRKLLLDEFQITSSSIVIAVGASSGGGFAAQLAADGIADAALMMVSSLGPAIQTRMLLAAMEEHGRKIPPLYLAPMPRDAGTTKAARRGYDAMTREGHKRDPNMDVPIVLDETSCVSLPVTVGFLNERVPHMSYDMAVLIVNALRKHGHLDLRSGGYLVKDPTKSDWRIVLQNECGDVCLRNQPLGPGLSPLAKALHRAWAFHEYCSEVVFLALDFFELELGIQHVVE